ncbi:MAG: hypothetical protein V3U09_03475 [Thermoplasmata archaeon]
MNDLATFIVINMDQNAKIPLDLVEVLKKHGWMMVRKNSIFVLPWQRILDANGKDVSELMARIENVRLTLRKLRMDYDIRTMGSDQIPT